MRALADSRRPPLKAHEVLQHPKFGHTTLDLVPDKKGKFHVARDRGGPLNIAYEVHGTGSHYLVFIMGLGTFKTHWQRQVQYFGHEQGSQYSCLIFDNRGMGESDKPLARYSTTEMAKDTLELTDFLGWTSLRQLHIIGVSMGGMIAQELALMIPDRVASLSLVSTAARLVNTVGYWTNLRNRINMLIDLKARAFSQSWLEAPDDYGDFPTNGDRVAAMELEKRQDVEGFTRKGFICQAIAAGWHHKSPEQLKELADRVGRQRIQVLHGTLDNMITAPHGDILARELGGDEGVTKIIVEGRGHVLHMEEEKLYREVLQKMVEKIENLG
ncbi:MAG: hypothetical protein L6R42_002501 [Xanthoria sp. 1 TBL-2021]|nr:MAG: hypothetical protein L6R42_002501 [Xanthoria sp. 1 TBL-2021]